MSYRYMRIILFFDLPTKKKSEVTAYRKFLKNIKKLGFYMLQESVYVKLCMDPKSSFAYIEMVKTYSPKSGSIILLSITEKQFANMYYMFEEQESEIVNSDSRYIEL